MKKPPLPVALELLAVGRVSREPVSAECSLYQGNLQGSSANWVRASDPYQREKLDVVRLGEPAAPVLRGRREQGISMNGTANVMGTNCVELSDLSPVRPA
jgi:hypothetical protein